MADRLVKLRSKQDGQTGRNEALEEFAVPYRRT